MVGPPTSPAPPPLLPDGPIPESALPTLRRDMKNLRRSLSREFTWEAALVAPAIADRLANSEIVGIYAAMSGEPNPTSILQARVQTTARPALLQDGTMVFRRWAAGDPEVPALWGGSQPADDCPIVEPGVILVPLVAFDRALNRMGQGGGHYDRYLAAHKGALRVGVAWEAQRVAELPVRDWDMPLDAVITEQNCYTKEPRACLTP